MNSEEITSTFITNTALVILAIVIIYLIFFQIKKRKSNKSSNAIPIDKASNNYIASDSENNSSSIKHIIYGEVSFSFDIKENGDYDTDVRIENRQKEEFVLRLKNSEDAKILFESTNRKKALLDSLNELEKNAKLALLNYDKGIQNLFEWCKQGETEDSEFFEIKTKEDLTKYLDEKAEFNFSLVVLDSKFLIEGFTYDASIGSEYKHILSVNFAKRQDDYEIESHDVHVI